MDKTTRLAMKRISDTAHTALEELATQLDSRIVELETRLKKQDELLVERKLNKIWTREELRGLKQATEDAAKKSVIHAYARSFAQEAVNAAGQGKTTWCYQIRDPGILACVNEIVTEMRTHFTPDVSVEYVCEEYPEERAQVSGRILRNAFREDVICVTWA